MPSKNPTIQKAYKDGVITKGQYDKLTFRNYKEKG